MERKRFGVAQEENNSQANQEGVAVLNVPLVLGSLLRACPRFFQLLKLLA